MENKKATETQIETSETKIPLWKVGQDSILEKNNPKHLDLTKHQLFIDTTRNSIFYKAYLDWNPHKFDKQAIAYYIEEISKKHQPKHISIGNFPDTWITLEKLNNEFVAYYKCDGISTTYFIDKNAVYAYNIEADADVIHNLKKLTDTEIEIEIRTITQKSKSEKGLFSIKKTKYDYVYILTRDYGGWTSKSLVTPLKHIDKFDLVVNNCVQTKRMEFKGFDKLNFDDY
ncbi:hypothetical protein [Winogradskyella sp.]|uniref:hypothetical protein n=1 Tax=Winogradskyella sp. TaxID=1883156 RepID=UPI003BAB40FC